MDLVVAKNSRIQPIEKENKIVVSSSSEISEKYVFVEVRFQYIHKIKIF